MSPRSSTVKCERQVPVVHVRVARAQAHMLVRTDGPDSPVPAGWEAHDVGLEELILAYLRQPDAAALPGPARSAARGRTAVGP